MAVSDNIFLWTPDLSVIAWMRGSCYDDLRLSAHSLVDGLVYLEAALQVHKSQMATGSGTSGGLCATLGSIRAAVHPSIGLYFTPHYTTNFFHQCTHLVTQGLRLCSICIDADDIFRTRRDRPRRGISSTNAPLRRGLSSFMRPATVWDARANYCDSQIESQIASRGAHCQ